MTNIIGKFDSETGNEVRNFAHIPWEEYLASKKYDKNIDNMCTNCIKEQKAKYGKITVECSGPLTIDNMVPEEVRHVLSTEELQLLREAYNPYEWAENNIDVKNKDKKERLFSKRWYQNQYTNCSSKRKTIRSGRRIGKALSVDTPIPTPDGFVLLRDIRAGDFVLDENGNRTRVTMATDIMYDHECYNVVFSDGTSIVADKEHLWVVENYAIRKNNSKIKTKKIEPITATTEYIAGNLLASNMNKFNFSVAITAPVEFAALDIAAIDLYSLGVEIGSICASSSATMESYSLYDKYIFSSLEQRGDLLGGIVNSIGSQNSGGVKIEGINKYGGSFISSIAGSLGLSTSIENTDETYCVTIHGYGSNVESYRGKYKLITSVEKIKSEPVKCIAVDSKSHLFLAGKNFTVTHNTFGVVLSLLHRMLTNNNYNILVVTPYDSQSEEVFTTMKKLLMNLEQPYDSIVKRAKESPYYIELRNGSRMKAFTVGNSGGGQIRGQPADILYVDEADLLTQKDFNSILAIMLDKPDTEMWVSSTPDGERQMYKLSQDEAFKEFHFPSSVLPHYNDKIDRDLRNQSDEMGYVQEVLAEFGASRLGVFQKYYIDMCTKLDYTITQEDILARRGDFIITMGCDWNHDQIGTRICVLAYDKKNNVFSIAEKASVSKEGWTQTMAMEKIIQLNRKYRFEKIYIDEGYGATQAEMLKGFAIEQFGKLPKNHPDLYLSELRAINFSSKIEIKDPYTGLDSKKDIKPYMVETLNRLIEKMVLKLHTDEDKKLIEQLKGYEEKRGVTGRPTYYASNTAVGDHDLDALMLAALAYNLEFSEIFANLRTEIAIKVLSQEDIHGASTTHLRPSAAYAGKNNDGLEIRTRKRENCSPKSRVLYVGARRQDDNNGEDNDIMRTSSLLYGKGTLLKKKGKRAQF